MSYVGVPPFGQTVRTVTEVVAQQDQSVFYPTGGYIPGYLDVELDGSDLGSQDFTATDGLSVVLTQKCGAGDLFRTKAYWPVAMVDTMRRAEINGIVGAGGWAMRNRLINGDMRIDQRNAGAVVANASAWITDRWGDFCAGSGKYSAQQSATAPAGFSNSLLHTVTTAVTAAAGDVYQIFQPIEGFNASDLGWGTANAQPVTVSFWVRSSIAGTYPVAIKSYSGSSRTYIATYTINAANTFEYKTVTIPGCTDGTWATNNNGFCYLTFDMGSGSNQNTTAGAWQAGDYRRTSGCVNWMATSGATFYLTGVQLEKGSYATPFDFRPIGTELALCQRYYWRLSSVGSGYNYCKYGNGFAQSAVNMNFQIPFPVTMRASPSSIDTAAASNFNVWDGVGNYTLSAITIDQLNPQCAGLIGATTGMTPYRPGAVQSLNNQVSYIGFSAEL
jgi:hypothetical protein